MSESLPESSAAAKGAAEHTARVVTWLGDTPRGRAWLVLYYDQAYRLALVCRKTP